MAVAGTSRTYFQTSLGTRGCLEFPRIQVPTGHWVLTRHLASATTHYFVWSSLRHNACPSLMSTPVLAHFQCCPGAHCSIRDRKYNEEFRCHQLLPANHAIRVPDADGVPNARGSDRPILRRDAGYWLAFVCLRLLQHDMAWPCRCPTDRCTIPTPRCISFRDLSLSRQC
jgi:hypothetical protein